MLTLGPATLKGSDVNYLKKKKNWFLLKNAGNLKFHKKKMNFTGNSDRCRIGTELVLITFGV